jgi:hypothetical protein
LDSILDNYIITLRPSYSKCTGCPLHSTFGASGFRSHSRWAFHLGRCHFSIDAFTAVATIGAGPGFTILVFVPTFHTTFLGALLGIYTFPPLLHYFSIRACTTRFAYQRTCNHWLLASSIARSTFIGRARVVFLTFYWTFTRRRWRFHRR